MRVDLDDVNYLVGDLWGGRSAFAAAGDLDAVRAEAKRANSGKNLARKGTWRDLQPLCLVRRAASAPCPPCACSLFLDPPRSKRELFELWHVLSSPYPPGGI